MLCEHCGQDKRYFACECGTTHQHADDFPDQPSHHDRLAAVETRVAMLEQQGRRRLP